MKTFDTIVIGSGPGGYVAAIRAAQLGMKVAVVERGAIGGRCLNVACIPAKAVLRAADVLTEVREAAEFGIGVDEPTVDWPRVQGRRATVVKSLTGGVNGLLRKHGVEIIDGTGSLTSAGHVRVGEEVLEPRKGVILATGSAKRPLPGTAFGGKVIGTEEAWALDQLPRSMIVIGSGASGSEIASAYARLGTTVTLFEAFDRVLPSEDVEISKLAERSLKKQGIEVRTGAFYDGEDADWIVVAAGRSPDVEGLGLAEAGIDVREDGLIAVDAVSRTSNPQVFAIGDLVPGPALAHKSSEEGIIAAEVIAGHRPHPIIHVDIPRATFCMPNIASFGLTEEQATASGADVVVGKVPYGAVGAGTVYGDRAGMIKLIGDRAFGEILGAHIIGAKATELIQEIVNVKALEGGFSEIARIVHGHPTLSEGVLEAARAADGWLIHG